MPRGGLAVASPHTLTFGGASLVVVGSGGLEITNAGIAFAFGSALAFALYLTGADLVLKETNSLTGSGIRDNITVILNTSISNPQSYDGTVIPQCIDGSGWTASIKYVLSYERTVFDDNPGGPRKPEHAMVFRLQFNLQPSL